MIRIVDGDLLRSDAQALVNTVNCVGVMGKGIALQFKQAYPDMFDDYAHACRMGCVVPGKMHLYALPERRFIVNFPTKRHWRENSLMSDVEDGLIALVDVVDKLGIESIAVPALGCSNGRLAWEHVRPRIELAFESLPSVRVDLYPPR